VQNNFEPEYEIIPDSKKRNNKKIVADLKKTAKKPTAIYLAADPDREGKRSASIWRRDRSEEAGHACVPRDVQ
jgi:DNA topoisomerase-1